MGKIVFEHVYTYNDIEITMEVYETADDDGGKVIPDDYACYATLDGHRVRVDRILGESTLDEIVAECAASLTRDAKETLADMVAQRAEERREMLHEASIRG